MSYKDPGDGLVAGTTTNNRTEIQAAAGTENPVHNNIGPPNSTLSAQNNEAATSHIGSLRGIVEFCIIFAHQGKIRTPSFFPYFNPFLASKLTQLLFG